MLTRELNELLTRTGPGTPMGELFRRFWLPAVLSKELESDGGPVRLRILHEDLLAFRNTDGIVGIVEAYCSHRLAPLFYGRNEQCGLRCPYHGWKFDVDGNCVELPNVPEAQAERMKPRFGIKAYPIHEAGGVVWIYMGPVELKPNLPRMDFFLAAPGYTHASRWLQRSNWVAGLEGEIDTAHISWLHKDFEPDQNPISGGAAFAQDGAPRITLRNADYGFAYGARRKAEDQYYWRVTHWLAPMFSLIPRWPGQFNDGGGRAWVPIDDDNVTTFDLYFRVDRPVSQADLDVFNSGSLFPPRLERGSVRLSGRSAIDTYLPIANIDNDYLVDREMQKTVNFSGIWGANEQDRALQESMAMAPGSTGIVDRMREHLIETDRAVATMRQRMIEMAQALAKGQEPIEPHALSRRRARALSRFSDLQEFDDFQSTFAAETYPDDVESKPTADALV